MTAPDPEITPAIDLDRVRFDHVGLSVPDLDAAIAWYCTTMGLSPAKKFSIGGTGLSGIMLLHEATGYRIELLHRPHAGPGIAASSAEEAAATLGYGHICLRAEDVRATYDHLIACGATTRKVPQPAPRPGATVSFVADPWGNLIEVIDRE